VQRPDDSKLYKGIEVNDMGISVGSLNLAAVKVRVVPASWEALEKFSHAELRAYAVDLGVKRGRCKDDTILNLLKSGKATLCASLGN